MASSRLGRLNRFRKDRKETRGSSPAESGDQLLTDDLSLKILAEGTEPSIDIVAVHGLNGHRDKTWTAANGISWIRDLLPQDIPNARIFCWGYDANTHGDRVSCQYLYDHARTLVSELWLERRLTNTSQRPILFVAHSLGGIVVKSALIHADAAREGALLEHRSIKISTYGIIFMGTPHQGGNGIGWGKLFINIGSVFVAADTRLMKHLEQNSEWLQMQLAQYNPIAGDFVTKYAYEEYETPTKLGHTILVVPRASAVVSGAADAESIVIHANHVDMVKFRRREDSGYRTISGHLRIMAQDASVVIASKWDEQNRMMIARLTPEISFSLSFSLAEVSETEHFVGRQRHLEEMHGILYGHVGRQTVTLHGLGGIGKTQLAVAYAKMHRNDYSAIFWVNIKDDSSVKRSFVRLARRITQENSLPGQFSNINEDSDITEVLKASMRWLNHPKNTRWLMIFDNYDDPAAVEIRDFLPEIHHGSVIITSRRSRIGIGRPIQVQRLRDLQDGLQILSHTSHRDSAMNDPFAAALAKRLDGLPLALVTAGAYVRHVPVTFETYLRYYEKSWLRVQETSPGLDSYDRHLYTTWQLSFDHIKREDELSAKILQVWAYFDNQDIWFELLACPFSPKPEWLSRVTQDVFAFDKVFRVLCDHGLVEADALSKASVESIGYSMHGCVHAWTRHVLNRQWDVDLTMLALRCVSSRATERDARNSWAIRERIFQHAAQCWSFIEDGKVDEHSRLGAMVAHFLGYMNSERSKFNEAAKMYQFALQGYQRSSKGNKSLTLSVTNNLGIIYENQGKLDEAATMYQHVLESSKSDASCSTLQLSAMGNAANIYKKRGELSAAEEIYRRALQGCEEILPRDHPMALSLLENLGNLYKQQDKLLEADLTYQKVLRAKEEVFGVSHRSTLDTLNSMGLLYIKEGRLEDATESLRRAVKGFENLLGPDHPSTLNVVDSLGMLNVHLGDYYEAEAMYQHVLQGYEKLLGHHQVKTYPPALETVENMAHLYKQMNRVHEAQEMYMRALSGVQAVFGCTSNRYRDISLALEALATTEGLQN